MEVSYLTKHRATLWPCNPTPGHICGEKYDLKGYIPPMFTAAVYNRQYVCVCACVCVRLVTQSCPTLCNHMDCCPPGSFVHGDLQARILEWGTMPSCRGPSQPWYLAQVSRTAGRVFTIWATTEAPAKTWNKRPNQKVGQRTKQTFLQRRHTDG